MRWQLRDALGTLAASGTRDLPVMGTPQTIEASWPPGTPFGLTLTVELVRPTGVVAVDRVLTRYLSRSGGQDVGDMKVTPP